MSITITVAKDVVAVRNFVGGDAFAHLNLVLITGASYLIDSLWLSETVRAPLKAPFDLSYD